LDLKNGGASRTEILDNDGAVSISWRKTSKMLEKACGKKVASKIQRNVAEDAGIAHSYVS